MSINQYDTYRVVSASLEVLNTSNATLKAGIAYGGLIKTKSDSSNILASAQTIYPLSTQTAMGIPNQCRAPGTFSQVPGVIGCSNQDEGISVLWYPLDDDCLAFNEPNTVEGGVAIGALSNSNTICYMFDNNGSTNAQQLVFSICVNYEIVSSTVAITYGSDQLATKCTMSPLQAVSNLGVDLAPRIISKFSDVHPITNAAYVRKMFKKP